MNTRILFLSRQIALATLVAVALMLISGTGTTASAQKRLTREVATTDMLSYALNLKTVSDVAVYSENGTSDKGGQLTNGYREAGSRKDGQNRLDLANAFSAINQLPCAQIGDTDLNDKTFGPGVYCLASANLASRMVLDGQNNPNATFVFRTVGSLTVKGGAQIELANGAQSSGVYFVSSDQAQIGDGVSFKGNVIAAGGISVGENSTVDGRVMSVKGSVEMGAGSLLGPEQTGVLEICKAIDPSSVGELGNRVFRFSVGNLIVPVVAGSCSGPQTVPSGNTVITELQTGTLTNGTPFNDNFQLTGVSILSPIPATGTPLVSTNLPNFTATVNVRAGDQSNQTRVQFTNRFAITAIVEICKEQLDSGVTGFFNFTINEVREGNNGGALVPFTVPVGQCSGPIAVVTPSQDFASPNPREGTVTINELARTGFLFTSATTADGAAGTRTNRLISFNVCGNAATTGCSTALGNLNGGGSATVYVVAGPDGGITTNGGTAAQTTVFFNNRTAPGQLKICKIAGPGVPEFTVFNFDVVGTGPTPPVTTVTTVPVSGTAQPGASLNIGQPNNQTVSVFAGPAASNGYCQVATGFFVVDTLATITEQQAANTAAGAVRVSRITSNSGIVSAGASINPVTGAPTPAFIAGRGIALFPLSGGVNNGAASTRTVTVPIIRETTEVEYVNFAFTAVPVKVCKVAGTGVTVGTPFTFTVTADTVGGLFAPFSSTLSVQAGPAATTPLGQNGFCDFASGPFSPTINGLTSFNVGSLITVQETGFGATVVPTGGITSPTGGVITNTSLRTAMITLINGVNEVQFVNNAATAPTVQPKRKRIRFF